MGMGAPDEDASLLIAADPESKATARPWHVTAKSASTAAAALPEVSLTSLTLLEELSIWPLQEDFESDILRLLYTALEPFHQKAIAAEQSGAITTCKLWCYETGCYEKVLTELWVDTASM